MRIRLQVYVNIVFSIYYRRRQILEIVFNISFWENKKELKNCFDLFDTDKSGSISSSELNKVVEALGIQASPAELKELLKLMDKDGNQFSIYKYSGIFRWNDNIRQSKAVARSISRNLSS
jgi:hypothetical protein